MAFVNFATRDSAFNVPGNDRLYCSDSDEVLKAFNTWAFKREQPSDISLLRSFVSRAVRKEEPVSFIAYWGKGPRDEIADPDLQCLPCLQQMMRRIDTIHKPGSELHLMLTDSHARLNDHKARSINKYFKAVEAAAHQRGFSSWRLQSPTASMQLAPKMIVSQNMEHPKELLIELKKSSTKWHQGGKSVGVGAKRSFNMNIVERRVIERICLISIFITFNSSDICVLFPNKLPVFYMYSMKKGVGLRPWFQ